MSQLGRWSSLVATLALAACTTKHDAGTTDSAGGAVVPAPAASTADSSQTTASAAPAAPAMTDANILAKEHGGDSAEVTIASFARTHASDAGVKAYATLLVNDHGKGDREVQSLAKKLSIAPQPPAGDTTSQETAHTLARLGTLKGFDFDTAFVKHEIQDHQADIDDAHKASAAAQNAEVKALVEKSLPELQKHLDKAQELDKKLSAKKG